MEPVDADRAPLIAKALMWAGVLGAILSIVGELAGWWNHVGEVGLTVSTIVAAIGGVAALIIGSSSEEVRSVHAAVARNGDTLASVDDKLEGVDDKLERVDGKLEGVDGKLERLEVLDAVDSKLDAVQVELHRQTGVMGEQVEILGQIRDRLQASSAPPGQRVDQPPRGLR